MNTEEIKNTDIWDLYEKNRSYLRMLNSYTDTDLNYRMYNGNQWGKAKLGDVEPVQKNFIKPIVKYKVGVIHDNLYSINYSSQNLEDSEFRKQSSKYCEMLNKKANQIWEKDKLDVEGRKLTKDSAINDEGVMYVDYDKELNLPKNERIKKVDVYYGNENDEDIQSQPYILIRKRIPVSNAIDMAIADGVSPDKAKWIIGDSDNFDESGESAKYEVNNMVTIITKMYKKNGKVYFSKSTKSVIIKKDTNTGLRYYPIAHFTWEEKEGSARGEGEVRGLMANQIEVNRTEIRRVLAVKNQAYPQKVVNISKVANPDALNRVGGNINITGGQSVDDVAKIITTLPPAQMSPDVKQLQEDLIQVTRDLAGAGDIATGQINPEDASGRAILAVQQASQSPMTEQKEAYKEFIEDLARIWLDMLITYNPKGIKMEVEEETPTGEKIQYLEEVPIIALEKLQATVKVDVTPKGAFDKYAQEVSIENLLKAGYFNIEKLSELKIYVDLLDDDSVMPKQKLKEAIDLMEKEQIKIAQIKANSQTMQLRANSFLNSSPEEQYSAISGLTGNDLTSNIKSMLPELEPTYNE